MASAQLSQFTTHMFSIPSIPKNHSNTVFPIAIPLYQNNKFPNISKPLETRKDPTFLNIRNDNLNNVSNSSSRSLPRVVFSAHFSPQRTISPSEFSSSPASYSSAEDDIGSNEQDAISTLASLAIVARKMHPSPVFSVASSVGSSPPSSPCSASPRRSSRKPKPSSRTKEQIMGKRRLSGPATRLRKHKSAISEDDEKELYYRMRAAPIPIALDAPFTKPRRIPLTNPHGVIGFGGYNSVPSKNQNYPIPPSKTSIIASWSPYQRKIFTASYLKHGKDFPLIGKQVHKTTAEVVEFYYLIKHSPEFRMAKAMKKELELYEEDLNKFDAHVKGLAKMAYGKKGGRKKKSLRN
ncbi:8798_t:CDS:1 [Scutellospora calospora]|uniref:8798_t:CDS:1 n=1 Tax=Scutellospora calospora TaxID=85575 RepID=A0ACA9KGC9_9GLOM|nr:8798_t:CDS:1 [Scutellospora calospora]